MGHSHSGFASTKLKPPNNTPVPVTPSIVITAPNQNTIQPSTTPHTPSNIMATAPYSPSTPQTTGTNTTPYYQKHNYNPQEQNPYGLIDYKNNTQHQIQETTNPYINGFVNPYYASIHQNIDIKECTTPIIKKNIKHSYRKRCDSTNGDVVSFSQIAQTKIALKNKVSKISTLYKYIKQLGTGATSRVLLVEHIHTHKQYAMKELLRNNETNHYLFLLEIKILNILKNSEGIVQIYDIYMDDISYYIVMEYCSGGSLLNKIIYSHHFSELEARKYIKCVLNSVYVMHNKNICHRDLKPNNIVFNENNILKIIDFGHSEVIDANEKIYGFKQVGTTSFVPPEFHRARSGLEIKKGDSWAIGCICFLIMAGKTLFGGNNSIEIWKKICIFNSDILAKQWPENIEISNECKDFISELLNPNAHKRLSIEQALEHEWIISDNKQISDIKFKVEHQQGLTMVYTKNKLQKILADAILEEMNENEIKILMENVKEKDDVIEQLLEYHHNNYQAINLNKKDEANHQELMNYRAHHVMNTLTEFKLGFKTDELFDDDDDDEKENVNDNNNNEMNKNESVSVKEFKYIMKQSKKEYNVDKLINDLDPNNTGFIPYRLISQFCKPVKTHRILPGIGN